MFHLVQVHPDDKIILIRSGQKAKLPPVKLVNQQQLKLSQDQLSRDQLSQEQLSTPYLQQPQKLVQAQENNGKVWRDVKRIKSKVAAPNTRHFEQKQRLVLMPGQTGLKETSQPGKPVVLPRQETAQSGPGQYSTSQPGQKARQSRPAVGPSDLAAGRSDLEAGRSDLEVGRSDIVAGRSDLAAGQPGGLARLAPTQEQRRQQRLSRRYTVSQKFKNIPYIFYDDREGKLILHIDLKYISNRVSFLGNLVLVYYLYLTIVLKKIMQ